MSARVMAAGGASQDIRVSQQDQLPRCGPVRTVFGASNAARSASWAPSGLPSAVSNFRSPAVRFSIFSARAGLLPGIPDVSERHPTCGGSETTT